MSDNSYRNGKTYAVRFKGTKWVSAWMYECIDTLQARAEHLR